MAIKILMVRCIYLVKLWIRVIVDVIYKLRLKNTGIVLGREKLEFGICCQKDKTIWHTDLDVCAIGNRYKCDCAVGVREGAGLRTIKVRECAKSNRVTNANCFVVICIDYGGYQRILICLEFVVSV